MLGDKRGRALLLRLLISLILWSLPFLFFVHIMVHHFSLTKGANEERKRLLRGQKEPPHTLESLSSAASASSISSLGYSSSSRISRHHIHPESYLPSLINDLLHQLRTPMADAYIIRFWWLICFVPGFLCVSTTLPFGALSFRFHACWDSHCGGFVPDKLDAATDACEAKREGRYRWGKRRSI